METTLYAEQHYINDFVKHMVNESRSIEGLPAISLQEIIEDEAWVDYIASYDCREYYESRFYTMQDDITAFSSNSKWLETEGDLYRYCIESFDCGKYFNDDSYFGTFLESSKPSDIIETWEALTHAERKYRVNYFSDIDGFVKGYKRRFLDLLESFIVHCNRESWFYYAMDIERKHLEYLENKGNAS